MYNYFIFSFILSIIFSILGIPYFRRIKCGQSIREVGPKEHLKKSGTPTMGGVFIVFSICTVLLVYYFFYDKTINLLMLVYPIIYFCFVGFIDDFLKVKLKDNRGISPLVKITLQLIGSLIYVTLFYDDLDTTICFFCKEYKLGNLYYLFVVLNN